MSSPALTSAERRLGFVLRLTAFGLFIAALVYALGPFVGPAQGFFNELPFVANSVVKVTILGLVSLYAAGDVRRRTGLVVVLILAHLVSVAAMASMLLFAETAKEVDLGLANPDVGTVLWYAIGLDGAITLAIAGFYLAARRSTRNLERPRDKGAPATTSAEQTLRWVLIVFAVLFALGGIAYEIAPFLDTSKGFARELPFVTNSVVRMATLAMLCGYAAWNLERNMALAGPVIFAQFLGVVVGGAYLIDQYAAESGATVSLLGGQPRLTTVMWWAVGHEALTGLIILLAYHFAWKRRYRLGFLWPIAYRSLQAGAGVLLAGTTSNVEPEDVASRVEAFLESFRARRRWLYKVALSALQFAPLLEVRPRPRVNPPLSELDPESRRRFLERHFQRLQHQSKLRFLKNLKQIMIRICLQLTYAGYYGDERSYDSVGYKPFTKRPVYATLKIEEPGEHPLEVERPEQIGSREIETEICIVGSGAGGSILAYELAKEGHDVLVLERGEYVEPREFNESEIDMISRLYADGLMQQTEDWRFTILQGNCVGGSTTVNNAVCFHPPDRVLDRWNDASGHNAGIDRGDLASSIAAVEAFLDIQPQPADILNKSAGKYVQGAKNLRLVPDQLDVDVVKANIAGCYGSGYCNIGCRWGKKLSMLERTLPRAQRDGKGQVRILAECEVERIFALSGRPKHVTGIRAKFPDGRAVEIKADKFVLSAGAIASSYLLLQSGIARDLPVGEGFSANMGAPLTAEFEEPVNAYEGLQISHYGIPEKGGFVFETWFNPPVSQALNLPGWFEEHAETMTRYDHLMAVGVLVGTASNGRVKRALTGGPGVSFRPRPDDLQSLADGMKLLGKILFANERKPRRLLVNTWAGDEITSPDELDRLDAICQDPDYISLGTGHPQGGNALSHDPKRGVVDEDFMVHGFDNLHVCDASVFPTSLTVNPQLTVMSLAHYAARRIV